MLCLCVFVGCVLGSFVFLLFNCDCLCVYWTCRVCVLMVMNILFVCFVIWYHLCWLLLAIRLFTCGECCGFCVVYVLVVDTGCCICYYVVCGL